MADKKLSHFVSTPTVLRIMEDYGDRLERITTAQKFELIGFLGLWCDVAINAAEDADDEEDSPDVHWSDLDLSVEPSEEVEDILNHCDELNDPGLVGDLISGIADCL